MFNHFQKLHDPGGELKIEGYAEIGVYLGRGINTELGMSLFFFLHQWRMPTYDAQSIYVMSED